MRQSPTPALPPEILSYSTSLLADTTSVSHKEEVEKIANEFQISQSGLNPPTDTASYTSQNPVQEYPEYRMKKAESRSTTWSTTLTFLTKYIRQREEELNRYA